MKNIRGLRRHLTDRGDRGATGVEYALVVSLLLAGSTASIEMMDDSIEGHYSESASDIGRSDLNDFNVTTTVCVNSCSSTTTSTTTTTTTAAPTTTTTVAQSTTTAAPTTTTTAAPTTTTTAAPTTTTTAGPTTTAAPTTTTAPTGEQASVSDSNWSGYYGDDWGWDVYGQLRFRNDAGENLSWADVTYTITGYNGDTTTVTATANGRGKIVVDWWGHEADIFPATITIVSVNSNGEDYTPDTDTIVWDS